MFSYLGSEAASGQRLLRSWGPELLVALSFLNSKGFGPPAEIMISAPYWDFR